MIYDATDIAERYDSARHLPDATKRLWLEAITADIPIASIQTIVDIGCGTGRFSEALSDAFDSEVIGIDSSGTMLERAKRNTSSGRVYFCRGKADRLPLLDWSACFVYLSMVYHHLGNPSAAAREFARILRQGGFLCIRNSTSDLMDRVPYLKYFPTAVEINRRRLPSNREIKENLRLNGFTLLRHQIIEQEFANSFGDYVDKISQRGLSDLASIPDRDFVAGIERMKNSLANDGENGPVVEPIDLFSFTKAS